MNSNLLLIGQTADLSNRLGNVQNGFRYQAILSVDQLNQVNAIDACELIIFVVKDNFLEEIAQVANLKKYDSIKNIPVLVIDESPIFLPENVKMAFKLGANDYISKNVSGIELVTRIENQIQLFRKIKQMQDMSVEKSEILSITDKLILFMNSADNSFILFSGNGEIEWVNEGFNRMYGYDLQEFKKHFGKTIYQASKNSNIKEKVERCKKTHKSINYIAECQIRSGEYKWIQTTLTPVVASNGDIERFIAIETDITKQKEAEEALSQKNEYMLALTNHLKSANLLLEEQQKEINVQNKALEAEREKSEELLLNILPYEVARQLKSKGVAKPRNYRLSTVMFLDFVGFTKIAQELSPKDLIQGLDSYFSAFDEMMDKNFIEKIKTIGDSYMCAGGLPLSNKSNPFNVIVAALEIQQFVNNNAHLNKTPLGQEWRCRIGIHSGAVIAGVVGKKKYIYDIWGNTVNIASRMQQQGEEGRINITGDTYEYVRDYFECEYRGKIAIKNCDQIDMYFVNRLKPDYAADTDGIIPNDAFGKMLNSL